MLIKPLIFLLIIYITFSHDVVPSQTVDCSVSPAAKISPGQVQNVQSGTKGWYYDCSKASCMQLTINQGYNASQNFFSTQANCQSQCENKITCIGGKTNLDQNTICRLPAINSKQQQLAITSSLNCRGSISGYSYNSKTTNCDSVNAQCTDKTTLNFWQNTNDCYAVCHSKININDS